MKKLLFLFTAVISLIAYSTSIHADGVVKIYKNGSCTVFQANEVDSVVFASSSDSSNDNPLVGTWIVKDVADEADIWFIQITLKSDGTGSIVSDDEEEDYEDIDDSNYYVRWTINGNTLRIDMGEGHPDDSLIGTYTLNGNTLTYSFHWKDYDGKWEGETNYTMILERK